MAGEIKHVDVGSELSKAEWESGETHILDSGAQGDMVYRAADGRLVRLPAGTAGHVLRTGGAGANPAWAQVQNLGLAADVARLNLLTNPGFEVWQRGAGAFTAHNAYTADRWQGLITGGSTYSLTRITSTIGSKGFSVQAVVVHAGGGAIELSQAIEDFVQLRGKAVTFSVKVKATVIGTVRVLITDSGGSSASAYNTTTSEETLTVTRTVDGAASSLRVYLQMNIASATVEANDAVLVPGTVAADYVPLHPADEWARCQRYYELQGDINGYPYFYGYQAAGVIDGITLNFNTRKATTPTVTKNGTWTVANCGQPLAAYPTPTGHALYVIVTALGSFNCNAGAAGHNITAEANP